MKKIIIVSLVFMLISIFTANIYAELKTNNQEPYPFPQADKNSYEYKWGVKDQNGKIVIKPQDWELFYQSEIISIPDFATLKKRYIWPFSEGRAKILVEPKFKLYKPEGMLAEYYNYYLESGKYGFIDTKGGYVIKPIYDDARSFREGLARIKLNGKFGYIDKLGKVIIEPKFEDAIDFDNGSAVVKIDGKYGYIDKTGKYIVAPKFEYAEKFKSKIAQVKVKGKFGYIDLKGKYIIKPIYDSITDFKDGMAIVTLNKMQGIINDKGDYIVNLQNQYEIEMGYEPINDYSVRPLKQEMRPIFTSDRALIKKGGKYGYIDAKGKIVISPKFENYNGYFYKEVAVQELNGKAGLINKFGKFIVSPKFDGIYDFIDGIAIIYDKNQLGYINYKGQVITKPIFDMARNFSEGLALVQQRGKYGYVNKEGKLVIKLQFESAEDFFNGQSLVKKSNKYYIIDKKGKIVRSLTEEEDYQEKIKRILNRVKE